MMDALVFEGVSRISVSHVTVEKPLLMKSSSSLVRQNAYVNEVKQIKKWQLKDPLFGFFFWRNGKHPLFTTYTTTSLRRSL